MKSPEGCVTMSSMLRKMKRNKPFEITLSMRFVCDKCNSSKLIPRSTFQSMSEEEFHNGKIFTCDKCHMRMTPTEIVADF